MIGEFREVIRPLRTTAANEIVGPHEFLEAIAGNLQHRIPALGETFGSLTGPCDVQNLALEDVNGPEDHSPVI